MKVPPFLSINVLAIVVGGGIGNAWAQDAQAKEKPIQDQIAEVRNSSALPDEQIAKIDELFKNRQRALPQPEALPAPKNDPTTRAEDMTAALLETRRMVRDPKEQTALVDELFRLNPDVLPGAKADPNGMRQDLSYLASDAASSPDSEVMKVLLETRMGATSPMQIIQRTDEFFRLNPDLLNSTRKQ